MPKTDESIAAINESELDREWVGQAERFHKWATLHAKAKRSHANAKSKLELVEAQLANRIRINPGKFGIVKVTDAAVEKTVILQEEYQAAQQAVNDAAYRVDLLKAAVDALEHRKRALENLVDLWKADYFATPHERGETKKVREAVQKSARKTLKRTK